MISKKIQYDKTFEKKMIKEIYTYYKKNIKNSPKSEEINYEWEIRLGLFNKKYFTSEVSDDLLFHFMKKTYLFDGEPEIVNTMEITNNQLTSQNRLKKIYYFDDKFKKIMDNDKIKTSIIQKEQLLKYDFHHKNLRVQFSQEINKKNDEKVDYNLARYKSRMRFKSNDKLYPYLTFDITKIWEIKINSMNDIKKWDDILTRKDYHYEFEIEITNDIFNRTEDQVFEYINHILLNSSLLLDRYKTSILDIYYILNLKKSFRFLNINHITNSIISLSKEHLHLLLQDYSVTEKVDGERKLLWITDGKLFLVDGNLNYEIYYEHPTLAEYNFTLFDCEYYNEKMLLFDTLIYKGVPVIDNNLKERIGNIADFLNNADVKNANLGLKKFYFEDIFKKTVELINHTEREYEIDGLIFTPIYDGYYNKTFKWKPFDQLTNDFLLKYLDTIEKNGKKIYRYYVFVGLNKLYCHESRKEIDYDVIQKYFKQINLEEKDENYLPVLFKSDDFDFSILESETELEDDKIYECKFTEKGKKFEIYRLREDKTKLYHETCKIFGNDYKVACNNVDILMNPVKLDDFKKVKIKNKYYQTNKDISQLKNVRKLHNLIKKNIISQSVDIINENLETTTSQIKFVDIGCGRGGDIRKYFDIGLKYGLYLDNDVHALFKDIDCAIERYKEIKKRNLNRDCYYYFNLSSFMTEPNEFMNTNQEIFDKLDEDYNWENMGNNPRKFHFVVCNFAFHYALKNNNTFNHFIENIKNMIVDNGYLLLTFMNGKKIFDRVKEQDWTVENNGNKVYEFKLKSKEKEKFKTVGQKIETYIDSIGKNEEYLVNLEYIEEKFENSGFNVVHSGSFDEIEEDRDKLTDFEKEFSSLHHYLILNKSG